MGYKHNDLKPYIKQIHDMYWNEGKNFTQISKELGISSPSGIYRAMKKYDVVRTRDEQLQDLKKKNKGRKFTSEQKKRMAEGVKRSYTIELRKKRSEDGKRYWTGLAEKEKYLYVRHKIKTLFVLDIDTRREEKIIIRGR